jgi:ribosomal protein S18 acetylase RimI-like enzyme
MHRALRDDRGPERSGRTADVVVRDARRRDLRATARLHHACLPDGFFAQLGRGFLRRYHATFRSSPEAIAVVAEAGDGTVAGFLVGTLRNRPHYRWVLRHRAIGLLARLSAALLARPRLAVLFVRTRVGRYLRWVRRYPRRRRQPVEAVGAGAGQTSATPAGPVAVLTHVAVGEQLRGLGAGRALVERFVELAREGDAVEARLVTDAAHGAAGFYERLGWTLVDEHDSSAAGRVHEFRLDLTPDDLDVVITLDDATDAVTAARAGTGVGSRARGTATADGPA